MSDAWWTKPTLTVLSLSNEAGILLIFGLFGVHTSLVNICSSKFNTFLWFFDIHSSIVNWSRFWHKFTIHDIPLPFIFVRHHDSIGALIRQLALDHLPELHKRCHDWMTRDPIDSITLMNPFMECLMK